MPSGENVAACEGLLGGGGPAGCTYCRASRCTTTPTCAPGASNRRSSRRVAASSSTTPSGVTDAILVASGEKAKLEATSLRGAEGGGWAGGRSSGGRRAAARAPAPCMRAHRAAPACAPPLLLLLGPLGVPVQRASPHALDGALLRDGWRPREELELHGRAACTHTRASVTAPDTAAFADRGGGPPPHMLTHNLQRRHRGSCLLPGGAVVVLEGAASDQQRAAGRGRQSCAVPPITALLAGGAHRLRPHKPQRALPACVCSTPGGPCTALGPQGRTPRCRRTRRRRQTRKSILGRARRAAR